MIILASGSKARHELMQSVCIPHVVKPSEIQEDIASSADAKDPYSFVRCLARRKADRVKTCTLSKIEQESRMNRPLVLGCDTVVSVGGIILGKPINTRQADEFLCRLSGRQHQVITGMCLLDLADESVHEVTAESTVWVRALYPEERNWYLKTGEWCGAAGGYRVQGRGAFIVERIEGSYSNVVGLPLEVLYGILRQSDYFGVGQ